MSTIAFFNNKGGVGKSSAVINVAYSLASLGKKVLVVDCDSQKNSFNFFSKEGTNPQYESSRYKNIDIIFEEDADNLQLHWLVGGYDYIILDLPPALGKKTKKYLTICNYVFVPIELGTFSISGISKVTETIAETAARTENACKFGGCFVNKYNRNNSADRKLDELLRLTLGNKVMMTRIPYSLVIKNSISYRLTALEYMYWISSAGAFANLTYEILYICEGDNCNGKKSAI